MNREMSEKGQTIHAYVAAAFAQTNNRNSLSKWQEDDGGEWDSTQAGF